MKRDKNKFPIPKLLLAIAKYYHICQEVFETIYFQYVHLFDISIIANDYDLRI